MLVDRAAAPRRIRKGWSASSPSRTSKSCSPRPHSPAQLTDATYSSPSAPAGSVPGPPGPPGTELPPERRLTAIKGLIGFLVAIVATFVLRDRGLAFARAGADLDDRSFIFVGTIIQDAALIAAAYFITADLGRPSARTFGLRPFGAPPSDGWRSRSSPTTRWRSSTR